MTSSIPSYVEKDILGREVIEMKYAEFVSRMKDEGAMKKNANDVG